MLDLTIELQLALRAAHFALIEAADHIRRTEGHSNAYRRASNASDAVREALKDGDGIKMTCKALKIR